MRLIHTSDWHLGRSLHARSMLEDQEYALAGLLGTLAEAKPDALVIAGDIYDRAVPPADAVKLLDWFLEETVLRLSIPTLVIAGNHDSGDRLGFASQLLARHGLFIAGAAQDRAICLKLEDRHGPVHIYGLPFAEPAAIGAALGDPSLRDLDAAARAQSARCLADARTHKARAVVAAHAWVAGGSASDSERPLTIGGVETIARETFADFSYVALGHLHRPQSVGAPHICYSGSLLAYSFSEIGQEKSVCIVDIDAQGKAQVEREPIRTKRRLREVRGSFDAILASATRDPAPADYLVITLDDLAIPLQAAARLRSVYPNVLAVQKKETAASQDNSKSSSRKEVLRTSVTTSALFSSFWQEVTGSALPQALKERLGDVLQKTAPDDSPPQGQAHAAAKPRRQDPKPLAEVLP